MTRTSSTVITISGVPGSGTTTIAKLLSTKLNLRLVYIGEIFRELAKQYNMSLSEFGSFAKENPKIDQELDNRQVDHARSGNVILEGRLSGWMTKNNNVEAFKILLSADLDTRVNRIMGRENKDYDQVKEEIISREQTELQRYEKIYGINYQDHSHYDLVIETTNLTPEQIVEKIIENLNLKHS